MTVDRRIIDLYNEYVHTAMPRREFLAKLTRLAGGAAAATTALALLEPNYAHARQVEPDDKRLARTRQAIGPQRRCGGQKTAHTKLPIS